MTTWVGVNKPMEERARTPPIRQVLSQVRDALKEVTTKSENNAYARYDVEAVYREGQEQVKSTIAAWAMFTVIAKRVGDIFKCIGDDAHKEALGDKWFEELEKQREGGVTPQAGRLPSWEAGRPA